MSVEPGEGGQEFIKDVLEKIKYAKEKIDELSLDTEIEVDGGINIENAKDVKEAGTTIAVCGSAIINSKDYSYAIGKLKE